MMPAKIFTLFILAAVIVACQQPKPAAKNAADTTAAAKPTDAYPEVKTWLDDFKNFRNAVYHNDVPKMETYFDFPLRTDSSEIWLGILDDYEAADEANKTRKVFTATDFKQNYRKLFSPDFIKGLLKIKSDTLYTVGEDLTPELKTADYRYAMGASFDKATQILSLSISYKALPNGENDDLSEAEHSVIYTFRVIDNKKIKFDKMYIAG